MKVLLAQKEIALASAGRLTVLSVNAKLTVPLLDAIMAASTDHMKTWGKGACSLTVMRPNVAVPDDAARAHIRAINLRDEAAATSVVVLDGGGFWAAGMRGLLAGMSLVSPRAPRATGSVKEALEKLAPHLDATTGTAAALEPWIERFRSRHLDGQSVG